MVIARFIDLIAKYLFYIGVLSGISMTLLILASTLLRYVAGHPISFSDELAGLLFLTMAFTTFPHVLNRNGHICLDLIRNKLSPALKRKAQAAATLIFVAFAVVFAYQSWGFMSFSKMISSRTDVSGILLWPWMALLPISMGFCILVELKKTFCAPAASPKRELER